MTLTLHNAYIKATTAPSTPSARCPRTPCSLGERQHRRGFQVVIANTASSATADMSALLAGLAAASVRRVGRVELHWRLRRVASVDLLEAGGGYLLAARRTARLSAEAESSRPPPRPGCRGSRAAAEGRRTRAALRRLRLLRPNAGRPRTSVAGRRQGGRGLRFLDAVCAAGVTHVSRDGKRCGTLRFVTDRKAEDVATGRHVSAPQSVPGARDGHPRPVGREEQASCSLDFSAPQLLLLDALAHRYGPTR